MLRGAWLACLACLALARQVAGQAPGACATAYVEAADCQKVCDKTITLLEQKGEGSIVALFEDACRSECGDEMERLLVLYDCGGGRSPTTTTAAQPAPLPPATPPPKYVPCAGKSDGDMCTLCDPDIPACRGSGDVFTCRAGKCTPMADAGGNGTAATKPPATPPPKDVPCAGKSDGDMCTLCDPDIPACRGSGDVFACQAGKCTPMADAGGNGTAATKPPATPPTAAAAAAAAAQTPPRGSTRLPDSAPGGGYINVTTANSSRGSTSAPCVAISAADDDVDDDGVAVCSKSNDSNDDELTALVVVLVLACIGVGVCILTGFVFWFRKHQETAARAKASEQEGGAPARRESVEEGALHSVNGTGTVFQAPRPVSNVSNVSNASSMVPEPADAFYKLVCSHSDQTKDTWAVAASPAKTPPDGLVRTESYLNSRLRTGSNVSSISAVLDARSAAVAAAAAGRGQGTEDNNYLTVQPAASRQWNRQMVASSSTEIAPDSTC